MDIEVELRSFIDEFKYHELLTFFKANAKFLNEDYQETFYFDSKEDLRIQKNNFFSKIWMKKGKIHEEFREEIEVQFKKEDFEKIEKLFLDLGFNVQIKWFRTRNTFEWCDLKVMLDFTKGYGYIVEIEKMSDEENKLKDLELIKESFRELGIPITPKKYFDNKYKYYKENWKNLV